MTEAEQDYRLDMSYDTGVVWPQASSAADSGGKGPEILFDIVLICQKKA